MKNVIKLAQGAYLGSSNANGTLSFKGIPYALPPVGNLRFDLPHALPTNDRYNSACHNDATRFGPQCSYAMNKPKHGRSLFGGNFDEDCLYLNVFTPAADGKQRPVMLWIHGGAFTLGSANIYDGSHLAELGDVVVVTINYRLGVFGFVDIAAVTGETAPSNLGLRDIVAALQWVRDNVAAFGGDPDKVTISGESAGSIAVSLLLDAPAARGLFHQAIMQSGSVNLIQDRAMADATAEGYRTALGNPTLAQLRAMTPVELLSAQLQALKVLGGAIPAAPWYDDDLLPASQADAWAKQPAPVKLLAGFTREETALFEKVPLLKSVRVDRTFLDQQVNHELAPARARELLALYPQDKAGTRALATDLYFGNSTHHTAERQSRHASCWFYRFDYRHPLLGAAHGLELTFLWNLKGPLWALARGGPLNGKRLALAQALREHWVAFVRDGDPGESWRPFDEEHRQIMLFDFESTLTNDPLENSRSAWMGVNITPRYQAPSR